MQQVVGEHAVEAVRRRPSSPARASRSRPTCSRARARRCRARRAGGRRRSARRSRCPRASARRRSSSSCVQATIARRDRDAGVVVAEPGRCELERALRRGDRGRALYSRVRSARARDRRSLRADRRASRSSRDGARAGRRVARRQVEAQRRAARERLACRPSESCFGLGRALREGEQHDRSGDDQGARDR